MEEIVVGINPNVVDATPTIETDLGNEVTAMVSTTSSVSISNDAGYKYAGELLKQVKAMQKRIVDYWEPLRVSAKKSYDAVLARKKQMLDPVDKAEKALKAEMGRYTLEQQRKAEEERRRAEEEQRRLIREEMERKLAEAASLEAQGNAQGADMAMAEAEVLDQIEVVQSVVEPEKPKVQGVSSQRSWSIRVSDESAVPVSIVGVVIRPVDEAAILRLVKATKGKIEIPGVEIKEEVITRVKI